MFKPDKTLLLVLLINNDIYTDELWNMNIILLIMKLFFKMQFSRMIYKKVNTF